MTFQVRTASNRPVEHDHVEINTLEQLVEFSRKCADKYNYQGHFILFDLITDDPEIVIYDDYWQ